MLTSDIFCRKASIDDDHSQIAKYIHLTDPYIYPALCPDPGDPHWVNFVSQCLKQTDNIFSLEHISVVLCGCSIIGIACVLPCGKTLSITDGILLPQTLAATMPPVIKGYFAPLIEESGSYSGYNIANICIDEAYRNKGVGGLLMAHCLAEYGSQSLHLDVIAENKAAIRLYKRFGFQTEKAYMGYSGTDIPLPCYHMVRKP